MPLKSLRIFVIQEEMIKQSLSNSYPISLATCRSRNPFNKEHKIFFKKMYKATAHSRHRYGRIHVINSLMVNTRNNFEGKVVCLKQLKNKRDHHLECPQQTVKMGSTIVI